MREWERNIQDTCALSDIQLAKSKPDGSNIALSDIHVPQAKALREHNVRQKLTTLE